MNKILIIISLYLLACTFCNAQETFVITIKDKGDKEPLAYPEIQIVNKVHQIGDDYGALSIPMDLVSVGDTVKINYMGYVPQSMIVSENIKRTGSLIILLEEKAYALDEVVVGKNKFNSEKFFKKKKKFLLLPYTGKCRYNVDYKYYVDEKNIAEGKVNCSYKCGAVVILDSTIIINDSIENEKMRRFIKRGSELASTIAYYYCRPNIRKKFCCCYKGDEKGMYLFEFKLRPLKKGFNGLDPSDKLISLVSLDSEKYIKRIETVLMYNEETENTYSYVLQTDYDVFDRQVISKHVIQKILPNTFDAKERRLELNYSNIVKE